MHCDTSTKPRIPLHLTGHPRSVHVEALRFIRGVRGPRQAPVTRKQIGAWLFATPAEFVDAALVELIAEGKVTTVRTGGARYRNNATRRPMAYEVVRERPAQCEWDADDKTMAMPEWLAKDKELI
jgi:hypothetical protein